MTWFELNAAQRLVPETGSVPAYVARVTAVDVRSNRFVTAIGGRASILAFLGTY